jgi:hypothetical protein
MTVTYLGLVRCAKVLVYALRPRALVNPPTPQPVRLTRRIARRVCGFTRHGLAP